MAGVLGLNIYAISLSKPSLDDSKLNELMNALPEHCIALMEDIDAAFSQTINRDGNSHNWMSGQVGGPKSRYVSTTKI